MDKSGLHAYGMRSETKFVNLLKSPGIDSQPGGPVQQSFLTYLPARLQRLVESLPWKRFPGSLKVYKYGLWCFGTNRKNTTRGCNTGMKKFA
jgi:hypothetical protein